MPTQDAIIPTKYAEATSFKITDAPDLFQCVRIYGASPDSCNIQIRTRGAINENKSGKPVHINANAPLRLSEAEQLRDWLSQWIVEQLER